MQDLRDLRSGKITVKEGRARALLAREVLRSAHLQLEGMRFLSAQALPAPDGDDASSA